MFTAYCARKCVLLHSKAERPDSYGSTLLGQCQLTSDQVISIDALVQCWSLNWHWGSGQQLLLARCLATITTCCFFNAYLYTCLNTLLYQYKTKSAIRFYNYEGWVIFFRQLRIYALKRNLTTYEWRNWRHWVYFLYLYTII